jgi:hypothetical protein
MPQETEIIAAQTATQGTEEATPEVPASPFCRELRTKRYYFRQEMATEEHHLLDGSNRCWCRLTMQGIGPDREMVHPRDCKPGRSCYKSAFETE